MLLRALERVVDLMAMVEEYRTMLGAHLQPSADQVLKVKEIKTECRDMFPGGEWKQTFPTDAVLWSLFVGATATKVATITITAANIEYWNRQTGKTTNTKF